MIDVTFNTKKQELVVGIERATVPHYETFLEELRALKDQVKTYNAKSLVLSVTTNDRNEEPWLGLDIGVFSRTTLKKFIVKIK